MTTVALVSGPNVFLRYPVPVDEAEFIALRRASRDLHGRWEPIAEDGVDPAGPQVFASMVEKANTSRHQKHLVCRVADGRIVGYVGLNEIVMGPFRSSYLGYWTGAPHARRGYGREAVGLGVSRAFTELGLHRVEANIIPTNVASLALIRRLGFRKEGLSQRYLKIAGEWQDHERWAITLEEWSALRTGS